MVVIGHKWCPTYNMFNLLSGGVKKNPRTSSASKKDVELALAKWFSGARDRDSRRALRVFKAACRTVASSRTAQ
jgi:hypothetical protein